MANDSKFEHVLFTRFNLDLKLGGPTAKKIHDKAWLEFRFDLFRRYCYPSIANQTEDRFTWLVFFDPKTPQWALELMASEFPRATVVFSTDLDQSTLNRLMDEHCAPSEWLLTSSVDSDDSIHEEFIERLQEAAHQSDEAFLEFPYGYTMRKGRFYKISYFCNPFQSYFEPRSQGKTVYFVQHQWAYKEGKVTSIPAPPMWLQVIHGTNVGNDLFGLRAFFANSKKFHVAPEGNWGEGGPVMGVKEGIFCALRYFSRKTQIRHKLKKLLGKG